MKFDDVRSRVGDVPFITDDDARFLYDLILEEHLTSVLELGIAHGTATCFIAAALEELDEGSVTAVDLIEAEEKFAPSAEEQLQRTGLHEFAEVVRMKTGYNWFLHDRIRDNTADGQCRPIYDLCIIDGPKNWTIDGAAFYFVNKLLLDGGWIIFDDYDWTYADADRKRDATDGISHRSLSKAERETPHIREVFELLVKQHPSYGNFVRFDNSGWALAQKGVGRQKTYTIVRRSESSLKRAVRILFEKMTEAVR